MNGLEEQLLELETALTRLEVRRSPEALRSLLAEEFCEFGSSGRVYSRDEIAEALLAEGELSFSLSEFRVRLLSGDFALVTYRAAVNGRESLRSSVWVFRNNRWQIVFHQGTRIPSV